VPATRSIPIRVLYLRFMCMPPCAFLKRRGDDLRWFVKVSWDRRWAGRVAASAAFPSSKGINTLERFLLRGVSGKIRAQGLSAQRRSQAPLPTPPAPSSLRSPVPFGVFPNSSLQLRRRAQRDNGDSAGRRQRGSSRKSPPVPVGGEFLNHAAMGV
jgi:hypothetical protein